MKLPTPMIFIILATKPLFYRWHSARPVISVVLTLDNRPASAIEPGIDELTRQVLGVG